MTNRAAATDDTVQPSMAPNEPRQTRTTPTTMSIRRPKWADAAPAGMLMTTRAAPKADSRKPESDALPPTFSATSGKMGTIMPQPSVITKTVAMMGMSLGGMAGTAANLTSSPQGVLGHRRLQAHP